MRKITNRDISVTVHPADGFTLSCITGAGNYYHQRYMGYSVAEAKRQFKEYVCQEEAGESWSAARDNVLVGALGAICGGEKKARELLGNS
jgi:hypothetical protein